MLSGVLAYGQTLTFKSYKDGKVVATKTIPYPTKVLTRVIYKYVTVEKIKKVNVPVPKIWSYHNEPFSLPFISIQPCHCLHCLP